MNTRLLNKIDDYHSGKLTKEELVAFEKALESDPFLKSESNFQKEIIEGLKEYRKVQIKARLSNLKPAPVWMEFANKFFLSKSFGGVAVASLIGFVVYIYDTPNTVESATEAVEIDAPALEENVFMTNKTIEAINLSEANKKEAKSLTSNIKKAKQEKIPAEPKKAAEEKEQVSKAFVPSFDVPDSEKILDEEALQVAHLDKLPKERLPQKVTKSVEVTMENTKNLNIRYKYYDGKLFLSGDFDRAQYEILEINSASGRRIYVKYLDAYYSVHTTDQFKDLPLVTDPDLIEELDFIKLNK